MSWLLSLYIGATVLGAGVTIIDLLGLIGSHSDDAGSSGGHDGDQADGDQADGDQVDGDISGGSGHDDISADTTTDVANIAGHESGHDAFAHPSTHDHEGSLAGMDRPEKRSFVLASLTLVRSLVYFCLGFGPVGWFALATTARVGESLAWSVPVGVLTVVGTRALRRLMRRELNSEVQTSELLLERGVVTVSIGRAQMGKVRVRLGDIYVERFARSVDPERSIGVGTAVRVTDVSDECIFVGPEDEELQ